MQTLNDIGTGLMLGILTAILLTPIFLVLAIIGQLIRGADAIRGLLRLFRGLS